jgi:hypothetical protein
MSKFKKLINTPGLFFKDMVSNQIKPQVKPQVKPQKSEQAYLEEINNFSNSFDVNNLKVGTEYIWPYIRQHFWVQLYLLGHGKYKNNVMVPERLQLGSNTHVPAHLREHLKKKYNAFEISDLTTSSLDFLFITVLNASEQVELDNGDIYFRITDPFYEIASKIGNAKKLEMIKVNTPVGLLKIKKYKYKPIHILSPMIIKSGYSNLVNYYYKFIDILRKKIPSLKHEYNTINKTIDWELHTRDYYIKILKKLNPKFIFVNGFHYQAPLISAAHHLNIKTIDIQHGIQVGWNPLYNNWDEIPKEGYQSVPDKFFVWGQKEFDNINNVFQGKKHTPIIVGNPWLERQLELSPAFDNNILKTFSKYKLKILVILQNQTDVPELIKELISQSSDDILWIVRHHPKGKKFKLNDFGNNSNVLVSKYVDTVSLSQLLKNIDITISAGSTVSWESDYFGNINFIFSNEGKENYKDEIEKEQFYFIENSEDFYEKIFNIDFLKKESRVNSFEKVDIKQVLTDLLKD